MKTFKQTLILATLALAGSAALADDITMAEATPSVRSRDAVLMELRQAQADGSLVGGGELALMRVAGARSAMADMAPVRLSGRLAAAQFAMLYGAP